MSWAPEITLEEEMISRKVNANKACGKIFKTISKEIVPVNFQVFN